MRIKKTSRFFLSRAKIRGRETRNKKIIIGGGGKVRKGKNEIARWRATGHTRHTPCGGHLGPLQGSSGAVLVCLSVLWAGSLMVGYTKAGGQSPTDREGSRAITTRSEVICQHAQLSGRGRGQTEVCMQPFQDNTRAFSPSTNRVAKWVGVVYDDDDPANLARRCCLLPCDLAGLALWACCL